MLQISLLRFYEKSLSKATLERPHKALKSQIRNFTKFAKQPIYPILSKHNKRNIWHTLYEGQITRLSSK